MKKLLFLLFIIHSFSSIWAQKIQINEDPAIGQLMAAWKTNNRTNPRVSGWRVQLLSTTERRLVEEGKTKFRTEYPDIPADWVHEKPYYKLRAGAFLNKLDAMVLILQLKDTYPGAYPAQDANIHPRAFIE